ncbi:MAG: 7-cyano-7-deazaguanine synthase, partial [Methanomassiliicoccales archaeon]
MSRAVVLLSGGLDSTVTLAHALSRGEEVIPLTFLYGQRHRRELLAAKEVADHYHLDDHVIMEMDLGCFSSSALTGDLEVPEGRPVGSAQDIPVTYVPARNIIFLSIASGLCESESA